MGTYVPPQAAAPAFNHISKVIGAYHPICPISSNLLLPTSSANQNYLGIFYFNPDKNFSIDAFGFQVSSISTGGPLKPVIYSAVNSLPASLLYEGPEYVVSGAAGLKTAPAAFNFKNGAEYFVGWFTGALTSSVYYTPGISLPGTSINGYNQGAYGKAIVYANGAPVSLDVATMQPQAGQPGLWLRISA